MNILTGLLFISKIKLKWRRLKRQVPLSQASRERGPAASILSLEEVLATEESPIKILVKRERSKTLIKKADLLSKFGQGKKSSGKRKKPLL